jgi:O-acetyl-ADP-ribose deacetylase (regulator of RNase III)
MVIVHENKNIFDSKVDALVNPVNTHGVMGAGLAKAFKTRYPEMFDAYKAKCKDGKLSVGKLYYYTVSSPIIICFPTKEHWTQPSQKEFIVKGVENFCTTFNSYNIKSVAFPALGCGLGGLSADDIIPLMKSYFEYLPIYIEIYK